MQNNEDAFIRETLVMSPLEMLAHCCRTYPGKVAFGTSLGAEDQVLTDMIAKAGLDLLFFTLDTGRHFQETFDIMDITEKKYGIRIHLFFPNPEEVEEMVAEKGINLFYSSVENRKRCCQVRKINPLSRALAGKSIWISGLRREQSVTRQLVNGIEWDENHHLYKLNPLSDWTELQVWNYLKEHHVPYNGLHDKGFPSIGCQPCTRAIQPGEETRAGRWWWELPEYKECGLHHHD